MDLLIAFFRAAFGPKADTSNGRSIQVFAQVALMVLSGLLVLVASVVFLMLWLIP